MGKRGHTCPKCGYWEPFNRGFFPSTIERDIWVAQPLDLKEWDEELFAELMVRDCVEIDDYVYWWNRGRTTIKRATTANLIMKLQIQYDKAKTKNRSLWLKLGNKRLHSNHKTENPQAVLAAIGDF